MPTARELGFSMPAEWHPHDATWMSWPKNPETFPPRVLAQVEETFCQMAKAIAAGEKCKILAGGTDTARIDKMLSSAGVDCSNVVLFDLPSVDVWIRDYGPIFVLNRASGKKALVKWEFNAWGGKYDDLAQDSKTGELVAAASQTMAFVPKIVLEGGSIDSNGAGSMLTTKQCLLNKNRNPALSQEQIAWNLQQYLGASRVIWLAEGIEGDDTDGHIDDFARFVSEKTVVCASEPNENDKNHKPLAAAKETLSKYFEVVDLPMPKPLIDAEENRRLPASHANFYISNKTVLMPAFGGESDKQAAEILSSCFAGREVVPINAKELVFGYGGIHCATQQEPTSV